jgi:pimeloyl-ACP methyl ester carboxylesterase
MGGVVCSLLTSAFPDRIVKFVSLDILGPPSLSARTVPMQLRAMVLRQWQLARRKPRVYASLEKAVDRRLESNPCMSRRSATLLAERGTAHVDLAEERVDEEEQSVDGTGDADEPTPGVVFRHDQRIHLPSPMYAVEEQVLAYLRGVTAPTLVIWAEDRNYPVDMNKQRHRQSMIPDLVVVHVQGTHHVHLDAPERVLPHILAFLFPERIKSKL